MSVATQTVLSSCVAYPKFVFTHSYKQQITYQHYYIEPNKIKKVSSVYV